ncbi:MAG: class I SAM-dependent methyltransferase, partial [Acidobacteriota bacterium]
MREGQRSLTAEATAAMRAAHQVFDAAPLVLRDDVAARLLLPRPWQGLATGSRLLRRRRALLGMVEAWLPPRAAVATRRLRAQIVVRSRYAEDALAAAQERGVEQYVVLAAGLDTFSLRQPAGELRVFEVDEPSTQADKRKRIRRSGLVVPETVEFVGIDFERQTLSEALEESGFDADAPCFLSWLGVSYYLTRPA